MKWHWFLGGGLVVGAGVVAGGIYVLTSLWIPWAVLPVGAERAALDVSAVRQVAGEAAVAALLPPPVQQVAREATVVAWTPDTSSSVTVVQPRFSQQLRLPAALQAAGWRVQRWGAHLLVQPADASPISTPPFFSTLAQVVRTRFLAQGWPMQPVGLWHRTAAAPSLFPGGTLIATMQAQETRLLWLRTEADRAGVPVATRPVPAGTELEVVFDGQGLAKELVAEAATWDRLLAQALHFTRNQPAFTEQFTQHAQGGRIVLAAGDEAAVQVRGNASAFVQAARAWVQDEERRGRLITRAFRLPDGTIGQERVPGEARQVFSAEAAGCLVPDGQGTTLWLCHQGDVAVLATNEQLARTLLALPTSPASVFVSAAGVQRLLSAGCGALPWCQLADFRLMGGSARAAATLHW